MSAVRSTWWWSHRSGTYRAVTARNVETNLRTPAPNGPGLFRHDARKLMAEHRAGKLAPIPAGDGWYSYGEEPQRSDRPILYGHKPDAALCTLSQIAAVPALASALELIRDARDFCANHGAYPLPPAGPDTATQGFDDWAADLAAAALEVYDSRKT